MIKRFELTQSQSRVLQQMVDFIFHSQDRIFILKGYAGTGKTTLMRFLIAELQKRNHKYKLLSTTGRAAKILSNYTGCDAITIHSLIYKFDGLNKDLSDADIRNLNCDETGQLVLDFKPSELPEEEKNEHNVYIIDESSMISDTEIKHVVQARFGTGRLLKELLDYDQTPDAKFVFIGDPCQLPPIEGTFSPALMADYFLHSFGLHAQEANLTEVLRQSNECSIINAASRLRTLYSGAPDDISYYNGNKYWAKLPFRQYSDLVIHADLPNMLNHYLMRIKTKGYNDSIFICRSNRDAYTISTHVRNQLGMAGIIDNKDLLMVIQNDCMTGLKNGDLVEVVGVQKDYERTIHSIDHRGYRTQLVFREITVKELFTSKTYTTLLLENTLHSGQNNLDERQQTGLFLDFIIRMKRQGITQKNKASFEQAMRNDPYLNALRCSYGYAVTCHKAQGGEWNHVYIHTQRNIMLNPTKATYQWLYTALTRAKEVAHLIDDFYIS